MKDNILLKKCLIWLFWIAVWEGASLLIDNDILFVGPVKMAHSLWSQIGQPLFWAIILGSFARISLGFLGAFICGILLGSLAYVSSLVREFVEPLMLLIKSVPVASFVILALIWVGSENLAVFISFLVVVPVTYVNTLSGLSSTDKNLLEMAGVFHIPLWKRIHYIYVPALLPYLISGCKTALGMSWKSGIAAEVIGIPQRSIGEQLYYSKLYLDTAELFAWTFVIIVMSALFEHLFLFMLKKIQCMLGISSRLILRDHFLSAVYKFMGRTRQVR